MSLTEEQSDFGYWDRMIHDAVNESDPALSNRKITRCHYLLSMALQQVLGAGAGANFHSWAVWGSRKAGVTIRQEDLDDARRDGTVVGGIVGCLVGLGLGWWLLAWLPWVVLLGMGVFGTICGAATGWFIIVRSRRISARLILEGNRTVLEDIGKQTARFISCFHAQSNPESGSLANFLQPLREGETATGGQELLRRAFSQYFAARFVTNLREKQEATYWANCLAVFHEHIRLEPYIRGSMPWIIRRCVTQRLLQYDIGPIRLAVAHDVPPIDGIPFPDSLASLQNRELAEFLALAIGCEIGDGPPTGTGAKDWTKIRERMRYIVTLFRALHLEAAVLAAPDDTTRVA